MEILNCEQRSEEWYRARIGIPSASMFSALVTPTGKPSTQYIGYAATLANELYLQDSEPDGVTGSGYMDRGQELEPEAVAWYEFAYNVECKPVGFIIETRNKWVAGCSPDSLVGGEGMLEIKCLKAENHTKALRDYLKDGTIPKDYVPQTQGQMMVSNRKWVDLLLYHPLLPKLVIRQTPQFKWYKLLSKQLAAVCEERDDTLHAMRKHSGEIV